MTRDFLKILEKREKNKKRRKEGSQWKSKRKKVKIKQVKDSLIIIENEVISIWRFISYSLYFCVWKFIENHEKYPKGTLIKNWNNKLRLLSK